MPARSRLIRSSAFLLALLLAPSIAQAQQKSAPDVLPASTLLYVELSRPGELVDLLWNHPLRKLLEQSPDVAKAMESAQYKQFLAAVDAAERRAGIQWRKAIDATTGAGAVLAFEPFTQGLVVLTRGTDAQATQKLRDALFALTRESAAAKGKPDPITSLDHRGITLYQAGEAAIAGVGEWSIVSNKAALAQTVVNGFLDRGLTLSQDEQFLTALASRPNPTPTAFAFLRLDPLRLFGVAKELLGGAAKSDNPGAEFLIGGIQAALAKSPYLTFSLDLKQNALHFKATSPFDRQWISKERTFWFAGNEDGAPAPLNPTGTLFSAVTYRDISAMWQAGPDLFGEAVAAQMAQADSNLSVFFGGKSFGPDVLGAMKPHIQIVVARQDYAAAGVSPPAIRLPSGAIIVRRNETAEALQKHFRVAFQTIVAFGNLDGVSKGRPLLEMKTESRAGAEIHSAIYDTAPVKPDAAMMKSGPTGDIHFNFSPSLVISKHYLMLCSTKQLADQLADLAAKQGGSLPTIPSNTLIEADVQGIAHALRDNREQLIAQNMLEKGHPREAAEREIAVLLSLLSAFGDADFRITPSEKSLTIELNVKTHE